MSNPTSAMFSPHWAMAPIDTYAAYMVGRFRHKLDPSSPGPDVPSEPLQCICEADRLVDILVSAFRNRVILPDIDVAELARLPRKLPTDDAILPTEQGDPTGRHLRDTMTELKDPAVIADRAGNIVVWYLPKGMSGPNQTLFWSTFHVLRSPLSESIVTNRLRQKIPSWRKWDELFNVDAELKGCIDLSPAWYQQGHSDTPEVSWLLKDARGDNGGRAWLSAMKDHGIIFGAAMAIMHPEMYANARQAMIRLGAWCETRPNPNKNEIRRVLELWPNIFSVVSVMVNRETPVHFDTMGRPQFLDLLMTVGEYDDLDLVVPTIGMRLRYHAGTVVAMSGQLLMHGVGGVNGNRGVVSFYMRENVHRLVGVPRCEFANIQSWMEELNEGTE